MYLGTWFPMSSSDLPGWRRCFSTRTGEPPVTLAAGSPSLFGLAPRGVCQATPVTRGAGGLLPHPFTLASMTSCELRLTRADWRSGFCGTFRRPSLPGVRPAVSRHAALRSSDFPRKPFRVLRDCPHPPHPAEEKTNEELIPGSPPEPPRAPQGAPDDLQRD